MERIYEYDPKLYRNKVTKINYITLAIFLYGVYSVVTASRFLIIWLGVMAVCAYTLINSYVRLSNPRIISISDDRIIFRSFGEKGFDIRKLTLFRVKIITPNYQVLVRAADADGNKGTFWVPYVNFSESGALIAEFDYLERKVHPDSLRLRGRPNQGVRRPHADAGDNS